MGTSLSFYWVVKLALVPVLIFHEDPFEKASLSQFRLWCSSYRQKGNYFDSQHAVSGKDSETLMKCGNRRQISRSWIWPLFAESVSFSSVFSPIIHVLHNLWRQHVKGKSYEIPHQNKFSNEQDGFAQFAIFTTR